MGGTKVLGTTPVKGSWTRRRAEAAGKCSPRIILCVSLFFSNKGETQRENSLDKTLEAVAQLSYLGAHRAGCVKLRYCKGKKFH